MGVDPSRVIHHDFSKIYQFKKLYVPSCKNSQLFLDEDTLRFYDELCVRMEISRERKNLLYVSRLGMGERNPNYRFFVNERELIDELIKREFIIFEPESYSFIEQIRTFASAKMVVGPSGAGMFNTVFTPSGATIIDIEAFPNWITGHANWFASCGHCYSFIIGQVDISDPTPVQKRWSLDIKKALARVDKLLKEIA